MPIPGLKPKDRVGIPHRAVFALQADGWWWRDEIVWHKKCCMPSSVDDRTTPAHEMLFLLTKKAHYYYDHIAILEPFADDREGCPGGQHNRYEAPGAKDRGPFQDWEPTVGGRNKRSVWTLGPEPFPAAHFATFPTKLVVPCVLAGTSAKGCCAKCGAPWVRVVEKSVPVDPGRGESKLRDAEGLSSAAASTAKRQLGGAYQEQLATAGTTTTGWRPTCACIVSSGVEGKCAKCGALWEKSADLPRRLTPKGASREAMGLQSSQTGLHEPGWREKSKWGSAGSQDAARRMNENVRSGRAEGFDHDNPFPSVKTAGWVASCSCPVADDIAPCVVLDPFSGSGTVGLVAKQLGRSFVGVELNPEYAALARDRIAGRPVVEAKDDAKQRRLFG